MRDKGTAVRPLTPPGVMLRQEPCDHQWFADTFEVKEFFPNGQIKIVKATHAFCLKCGEGRDL